MDVHDFRSAPEISSPAELKRLLNCHQAILHLDVGWSIYAVQNRPGVQGFREEIERRPEYANVQFRRIDISDQERSPLWTEIAPWLSQQGVGHDPLISGYGAILWIRDGKLAHWVMDPGHEGLQELRDQSAKAFLSEPAREPTYRTFLHNPR